MYSKLQVVVGRRNIGRHGKHRTARRPQIELLEGRALLSTGPVIDVTSADPNAPNGLVNVLRLAPEGSVVDLGTVPGGVIKFNGPVIVPYDVMLTDLEHPSATVVLAWAGPPLDTTPAGVGTDAIIVMQTGASASKFIVDSTSQGSTGPTGFGIINAPYAFDVTTSNLTLENLDQGEDVEGGEISSSGNTYLGNKYDVVVGAGTLNENDATFQGSLTADILVGLNSRVTESRSDFTTPTGYSVAMDRGTTVTLDGCMGFNDGQGIYNRGGTLTITPPPVTTVPAKVPTSPTAVRTSTPVNVNLTDLALQSINLRPGSFDGLMGDVVTVHATKAPRSKLPPKTVSLTITPRVSVEVIVKAKGLPTATYVVIVGAQIDLTVLASSAHKLEPEILALAGVKL